MDWLQSSKHTLTHPHNVKYTNAARESSKVCVGMGYYSDVQLYSESPSTLTALSGQLRATTSLYFENNQDSVSTEVCK